MPQQISVGHYSFASDVTVLGVCLVMLVLILVSFRERTRSFRIFLTSLFLVAASAVINLVLHVLAAHAVPRIWTAGLGFLFHFMLFLMMHHFVVYICTVTQLEDKIRKPFTLLSVLLLVFVGAADGIRTLTGGLSAPANGTDTIQGFGLFAAAYCLYIVLICVLLYQVRHRLFRRIMMGFYGSIAVSLVTMALARLFGQASFTVATFLFPVLAMFSLLHSNPYDARLGSNDLRVLDALVRDSLVRKKDYIFMSLYLKDLDENGKQMSDEMRDAARRFSEKNFRASSLFQISSGLLLLMFRKNRNPFYERQIEKLLREFRAEYLRYRYDYKIVIGQTTEALSRNNEYVPFIRSICARIPENTVYRVQPDDIIKFRRYEAILKALADIHQRRDLNDPRVLVYCQPVFNLATGEYDTAEALMRLNLEGLGVVQPDEFISVAEDNHFIHTLTEIILNKTCRVIRRLNDEGFTISRISVNVSALELKEDSFCGDIRNIIRANGLEGSQVAIELTESRSESDFLLMKDKITQLREEGIVFYLDDFGTGYSNMEQIMELPFDIIKFDRSMVVAGVHDHRSEEIVRSLANLFADLNYAVLYEGVENEKDEKLCRDLHASYLQGFRYSKPVPADDLKRFLARNSGPAA